MSKFVRATALGLALVGFAAVAVPASLAQKKDDPKKATKTTGIVEINEGKDGKFRFTVRDNDEKYVCGSTAYATEKDAQKGLEELKAILESPKMMSKKGDPAKDKDKSKDKDPVKDKGKDASKDK